MLRQVVFIFRLLSAVLMAFIIASSLGCRQSAQSKGSTNEVEISLINSSTEPQVIGTSPLEVWLAMSDGRPVPNATVELRGDMAHAGMVPVIRAAEETDVAGEYRAAFEWTMAGDWIVTVTATLPDGHVATRQFPITIGSE